MRQHVIVTMLAVSVSASFMSYAGEAQKNTDSRKEVKMEPAPIEHADSYSDMRSWVHKSLRSAGDNEARYVLRRIGCSNKFSVKESQKTVMNATKSSSSVEYEISQCENEKPNFLCLATLSLVRDLRIPENNYYHYCQNPRK